MTDANGLWAAVDQLTQSRRVRLTRDDDKLKWSEWVQVPSLWAQLAGAVATGMENGGTLGGSKYRTPVALDVLELAATIRETVVDALLSHGRNPYTSGASPERRQAARRQRAAERTYGWVLWPLTVDPGPFQVMVPESLRSLASVVAGTLDQDLIDWWTYRARSWVRQIENTLRLTEESQPRRIRDTKCPTCQATHVTIDTADGPARVPALLIDFDRGLVRAASCSACGDTWFRGDALVELADTIATRRASPPEVAGQI